MILNFQILLFFFFLMTAPAGAKDIGVTIPQSKCGELDIRDKMSPKLRRFFSEPRSQDGIGWCYAFAASDLLSAEIGEPVSALHTSAVFNADVEKSFFLKMGYKLGRLFSENAFEESYEGGWIDKAIELVADEKKICGENDMPFDKNFWGDTKRGLIMPLERARGSIVEGDQEGACHNIRNIVAENELMTNIDDIYKLLEKNNTNIALNEIVKEHCGDRMLDVPKHSVKELHTPRFRKTNSNDDWEMRRFRRRVNRYFDKIEELLAQGKPLGVSYDVKHIMDDGESGGHASVVTARRWRNGRCEFKVRNSWGRGCSGYNSDKIADCDFSEGSFWVTDQKFYEMAWNITYIDNNK